MTIPQLMTGEQQTVLVHTNASFMLDLGFGVLDAIGSFDVEGDLTGEGHDRNLWFCIDFGELVRAAGQDFDVGRVAIVEDAPKVSGSIRRVAKAVRDMNMVGRSWVGSRRARGGSRGLSLAPYFAG